MQHSHTHPLAATPAGAGARVAAPLRPAARIAALPALLPAFLYLAFSAADMGFSLSAFSLGVAEANPFLAVLVARGYFVPGKVLLSLIVAALMVVIYTASRRWRWTVWGGVGVMAAVVAFHVWALPRLTDDGLLTLLLGGSRRPVAAATALSSL